MVVSKKIFKLAGQLHRIAEQDLVSNEHRRVFGALATAIDDLGTIFHECELEEAAEEEENVRSGK